MALLAERAVTDAFRQGPHDRVELPEGRIAHWHFGSGPELIFVHGWPIHGATWRRIIPRLAQSYSCHVLDMPAVGHSEWDGPMGILEHATTVGRVIDALQIEKFSMVGHDSGGSIARFVAASRPDRVHAMVLGNTEIPGLGLPGLSVGQRAVDFPGVRAAMKWTLRSERIRKLAFASCFEDPSYLEGEFADFFVEPLYESDALEGQLRFMKALDWTTIEEDLGRAHANITCPVLLIWGVEDTWFPWKRAQTMVDSFGGPPAELHPIEGGKLFVHEDFCDEFAEAAVSFLDKNVRNP